MPRIVTFIVGVKSMNEHINLLLPSIGAEKSHLSIPDYFLILSKEYHVCINAILHFKKYSLFVLGGRVCKDVYVKSFFELIQFSNN